MVVPTLREISSSCGLSVKFPLQQLGQYLAELADKQVSVEAAYEVQRVGKRNAVKKVDLHPL